MGRFYPARFELVSSNLSAACGTFTYMNQLALGLRYHLEAQSLGGGVVRNYDAVDLGVPVASLVHVAEAGNDGVNLAARLSLLTGASAGDCVFSGCCTARTLAGATSVLYGRLMVLPSYGPENLDLSVGLEAQSFGSGAFARNLLDSCTSYSAADGTLAGCQGNLQAGETLLTAPAAAVNLVNGAAATGAPLTLSAPGFGHEGSVRVGLDVSSWLEFDWQGTGLEDPRGTATFGRHRGHDRIIFWREVQ